MKKVYVSETEGPKRRGRIGGRSTCLKELLIDVEELNKQGGKMEALLLWGLFGGSEDK